MKKKFFTGMAVLLSASLFFAGCGGDDGDDDGGEPSSNAALGTGAVVKGVAVDFTGTTGTGDAFATPVTGTVPIPTSALGGSASTAFTAADSGSSKAVRVAAAGVTGYTEANFNDAPAYDNAAALVAGDVFFVKVIAENGSNVKWYKITVLEDVLSSNIYQLKTTEGNSVTADTASGLTILSATKNGTSTTIKLGGTLAESFVYTADGTTVYPTPDPAVDFPGKGYWIGSTLNATPLAGKYTNAYIQGFFQGAGTGKVIAVKQTNEALRFLSAYDHANTNVAEFTSPKATENEYPTCVPTDTAVSAFRWKVYPAGEQNDNAAFGFLISDSAAPQTATFLIQEWSAQETGGTPVSNGYTATITVDYSAVNFGNTEAVANVYSLKVSDDEEADDDTGSGLRILSATKATEGPTTGVVTIKLGGTLVSTYVYDADGETEYESDPTNFAGQTYWIGNEQYATPLEGKYSNVFIQGFFAEMGADKVIAVKQTNEALRFFTQYKKSDNTAPAASTNPATFTVPKSDEAELPTCVPPDTTVSAFRWKVWDSTDGITADGIHGFLISDTAAPQTATFLIQEWSEFATAGEPVTNGYTATIIVDYSAVDFTGTP
jgi:hypothetical protein